MERKGKLMKTETRGKAEERGREGGKRRDKMGKITKITRQRRHERQDNDKK